MFVRAIKKLRFSAPLRRFSIGLVFIFLFFFIFSLIGSIFSAQGQGALVFGSGTPGRVARWVGTTFDYDIAVTYPSVYISQGTVVANDVTVTLTAGSAQAVDFQASDVTSSLPIPGLPGKVKFNGSSNLSPPCIPDQPPNPTHCSFPMTIINTNTIPVGGPYKITIFGTSGGITHSQSFDLTVTNPPPQATINGNPTKIPNGGTTRITWGSTDATDCTVDQGICSPDAGNNQCRSSFPVSGKRTAPLTVTTTFTITCNGAGGPSVPQTAVITVRLPNPGVIEVKPH